MLGQKVIDVTIPKKKINFKVYDGKKLRLSHLMDGSGNKGILITEDK